MLLRLLLLEVSLCRRLKGAHARRQGPCLGQDNLGLLLLQLLLRRSDAFLVNALSSACRPVVGYGHLRGRPGLVQGSSSNNVALPEPLRA